MRSKFSKCRGFFVLIPIAVFLAAGLVVMLLWNFLLPAIFGIKAISYIQALGVFVLSRILFGNFGFKRGFRHHHSNPYFKQEFRSLSDEEKQKLKEQWRNRCEH